MFIKTGNTIRMMRGDTANFLVDVDPYTYDEGDKIVFTVGGLIKKEADPESPISFSPEDTIALTSGYYWYTCSLNTSEGNVYTVLGPGLFILLPKPEVEEEG